MTVRDDHTLAAELATTAGEKLAALRAERGFGNPSELRKEGDVASHLFLTEALARLRPDDSVLSEEATSEERLDPRRLRAERVWIVDPLDGTREFAEEGREDWAVHVALWERGTLTAGAVALPAQGRTLSTLEPPVRSAPEAGARPRIAVSRTRPPEFVQNLAGLVGADLVPIGSAGAKISAVLTGTVEAYVHAGGQYEWDSAAPVAVALAAGAHASRIDGSPLVYNQPDPSLPDILVSLPGLAPTLLAGIRDLHR
ncbi:3'(2'),5'-bisphosphate nucleotidase CysQ [Streptosporangium sp. NBC_01755]|uniref:3'(2'),5'-bisphosphate nucleotidase CysQ n=1 Tax=unclassified Streptosporangium TaxID=2632669 RepID=UPI002DD9F6F4|nr:MULTISPECIES: 3'(2'),5'-bisphosphate nucleotidase CysQ [unclassified Streptosporangium]WSA26070.1 3'(2'),5'-bisphosphate nucleotidase CysQ [Streptosporangium sp. NBC_01810]WSD02501.1 3'(2'),5'-bisphosphate nucleotidase CysQ [Streptosporangium sp. NBC_01755]